MRGSLTLSVRMLKQHAMLVSDVVERLVSFITCTGSESKMQTRLPTQRAGCYCGR